MRKHKINKDILYQLLSEGKAIVEIAEYFGVTPAAVYKSKGDLPVMIAKDMHLESASRFVDNHLNTVEQLQKINTDANELLNLCMSLQRGDTDATELAEKAGYKLKDPGALGLKAMAEIRGQLQLQNQTLAMLAEMSAVMEFQEELISLLKEVDEDVKDEFLRRLSKRKALRGAVQLT
jgi:DNA repair exonuclease SbcCD ATPase subunit